MKWKYKENICISIEHAENTLNNERVYKRQNNIKSKYAFSALLHRATESQTFIYIYIYGFDARLIFGVCSLDVRATEQSEKSEIEVEIER